MKCYRISKIARTAALWGAISLTTIAFLEAESYQYTLKFLGIPCGTITMSEPDSQTLIFKTKSSGLIDIIFPFTNEYITRFQPEDYSILSLEKSIRQGSFSQTLSAEWNPEKQTLIYHKKEDVMLDPPVYTLFSLLIKSRYTPVQDMDTRWWTMEHEGRQFNTRFLWAESATLSLGDESIVCNHYRLDITDPRGSAVVEETDYFMKYVVKENLVRQVWVEQSGQRRIIKAAVSLSGISMEAILNPGPSP